MEICKTDTVRLLRLLKEAALIIEDNCRGIRSLDKARQLRQMAKKIQRKKIIQNNKNMNKIEKLAGEYNATFARLAVIESELTKECQKYVSWDTVQVSITGDGAPIVKARGEIDAVPLEDFVTM